MYNISALLSSVVCGRCDGPLVRREIINGIIYYYCQCSQKIRVLLTCTHCKKQFLNFPYLIRKTNYCCLECYWIGTNKKKLKTCKVCKKKFTIKSYLVKQGFGFYCSKKCWFSIFEKQRKIIKCKECQKERSVYRSVYVKDPKFCSKECSDDSKIDHIFRTCRECKRSFRLTNSALNRGRGSFCTWECYKKYKGESSLELKVRQQLEKLNELFQQEMRIGKFRADFYLPKRNLIIECDGEYWHMDQKARLRDQRKDKLLEELGYNILRLSGQDIIDSNFALETLLVKI